MKVGVIDIGSNSVRLLMSENGKTLYKKVETTRLSENMGDDCVLKNETVERTARAVSFFKEYAEREGAKKLYAFGTAALRYAVNSKLFTDTVENLCGLKVDIISGEKEAFIGALGVLNGKDGGIVDIGGASTEITVIDKGEIAYLKSVNLGAVTLKDFCGQDRIKAEKFVFEKLKDFEEIPKTEFFGIGGTITSLSSVVQKLEPYDPTKTHGYKLDRNLVTDIEKKLYSLTVEERKNLKGLQKERAEVISTGSCILKGVMEMLKLPFITVSENDNLEGYLMLKENCCE